MFVNKHTQPYTKHFTGARLENTRIKSQLNKLCLYLPLTPICIRVQDSDTRHDLMFRLFTYTHFFFCLEEL